MLRFIASAAVAIAGVVLLFIGVLAPLTPSEGLPTLNDVLLYALLPLAMIAVSIGYTTSSILRVLLTVVLIAAIFVLIYVGLSLIR